MTPDTRSPRTQAPTRRSSKCFVQSILAQSAARTPITLITLLMHNSRAPLNPSRHVSLCQHTRFAKTLNPIITILLPYCYYIITISLLYCCYIVPILLLYYYYIATILLLYYYSIITPLLLYCYYLITILLLSYYLTAGTTKAQEWFMAIGADAVCSESHLSSLGVGV